ncbi:hypothetical protein HPP92_021361 [Vanilla planifolia]|uniref:DNA-directed DNA polymerase n=1 Tax=Vanilla planifolia TaxID=51239 RepID=A0A835UFG1_VANPL|nr:hypothetical protein HPP92_021361 [Vanilla planifolia]
MESPFRDFVSSLFESRLEARRSGNEALAYVYKILMNSLYGRLGIHPKSTITEVCNLDRYKYLGKDLWSGGPFRGTSGLGIASFLQVLSQEQVPFLEASVPAHVAATPSSYYVEALGLFFPPA